MKCLMQKNILRAFYRQTEGSIVPIAAAGMLALVGATGIGIDMGRAQLVQARLSSSLDAAGLAAGASATSANLQAEASKFMKANFPLDYLGSTLTGTTVAINADNTIITLSATAKVPTTFMKIFGTDEVIVRADSEITRTNRGMELVLVLDNTGSMGGSKLTALKNASTSLVNILYGSKSTIPNMWIGLVPFAQAVNIGPSRTGWVSPNSFTWGPASWAGCVDAREADGRDITDDPPSVAAFPVYYWPDDDVNNDWIIGGSYAPGLDGGLGPNKSCLQEITPMTANKSTILNGINAMQARGNTHIGLGAVWGWRMLSPRWRNVWGGEMDTAKLPLDYHTAMMDKVVILMTDGDNTINDANHGAYWYLHDNKLGTTNQGQAVTQLNNRLAAVCSAMKANDNIIIYSIAFGNPGASAQTLLRNCASEPDYYFNSPTAADLQTAFRKIADSLANLHISH